MSQHYKEGYLDGYMSKEAAPGVDKAVKAGTKLAGVLKNVLKKAPDKYEKLKRYAARAPEIPKEFAKDVPKGAKKVKFDTTNKTDVLNWPVLQYVDPKTGYKHVAKAPSLLETLGKTLTKSPRIFKNPKLDKWMQRGYKGSLAAAAAKGGYDLDQLRREYDKSVQERADKFKGMGQDVLAKLTEQGKSMNIFKNLLGTNKPVIDRDHFLAPLNSLISPGTRAAAKEGLTTAAHQLAGTKWEDKGILKTLFKPPIQSTGVLGESARGYLGKPRTRMESLQKIMQGSITPEAQLEMASTHRGRIMLEIFRIASKLPAQQAADFTARELSRAQLKWNALLETTNMTKAEIEEHMISDIRKAYAQNMDKYQMAGF